MNISRHHADWLSLIEVSGPFLTLPVLQRVFPHGLDPRDPEKARDLRLAYEEWQDQPEAPGRHRAWVTLVLARLLEFPADLLAEGQALPAGLEAVMAEYGETLRPDLAVVAPSGHPSAGKTQLLLQLYPPAQSLDAPVSGRHWKASPATRMTELLHASGVPLGLLTNGEQWMLVYAPQGETTGYASWYAALWQEEPITLRAFHSLAHCRRFFGVAEADTLASLYQESYKDQQEVTDQLGLQVRRAVEVLVQALDRIDQDTNRKLLQGLDEKTLYEAALTVMMRLVFLFSAEERGMLRLGEPLYDENYAVSTLREQLREVADQHGEEILERRFDAWARLLATFRAVHGGIDHEILRLPAYGGTLFDPDRYPFLEGRSLGTQWRNSPADPLAIDNRVVLHLLESLQMLQVKVPGGGPAEARRLSFRALDIEQIGHVYEGLLDHTAVRASTMVLGLKGAGGKEPEVPLDTLETKKAQGEEELVEFLQEESGRSASALRKALQGTLLTDEHQLLIACGQDTGLRYRVQPFAGLIREDSFGMPTAILPGSVYVTQGTTRRSTGTHYTPRSLTEPIVQHTLEPLVYHGPAEGLPKEQWRLRTPRELLNLKVCDMTMGSGAFLVQTCRYLSERLVEAWENEEKAKEGVLLTAPWGEPATGATTERLLPTDAAERLAIARRAVADRCLYGVDINPMAVEMAKLSLWLITVQKDRPFTFLDHALKCGDSLLGITDLKQLQSFSLRPGAMQLSFGMASLWQSVEQAIAKRRELEDLPSEVSTQIEIKSALHTEAEAAIAQIKGLADLLVAFELRGLKGKEYEEQRAATADQATAEMGKPLQGFLKYVRGQIGSRHPFHWGLEFPEVFEKGGFDAFVGNPPFVGGKKITGEFSISYRDFLVGYLANGKTGVADLCAYFFLRARSLLHLNRGSWGLIGTNTIAQGDTREVGIAQIVKYGDHLTRAIQNKTWPGTASVVISMIWGYRAEWYGPRIIDDRTVEQISSLLTEVPSQQQEPFRLVESEGRAFIGSYVLGAGFTLTIEQAKALIRADHRNRDVILPYLGGEDLNSSPTCLPHRYVIQFLDWPLSHDSAPLNYQGPVAGDYPICLEIVKRLVKPERDQKNRKSYRENWWQFAEPQRCLYEATHDQDTLLLKARVTPIHAFVFVPKRCVPNEKTVVFPGGHPEFSVFQSSLHEVWAVEYSPTMGISTLSYSPSACVSTFPFPHSFCDLSAIGETYHQLRQQLMLSRQEGLTKTYNRFHNPVEKSEDIARLRILHVEMDHAVATAYGWTDLDLGHGFHETKQGIRFTLSEAARREVLDRLLALNHQRYAEEVAQGLHDKKGKKDNGKGRKKKRLESEGTLPLVL
jgi:hypothetical protein